MMAPFLKLMAKDLRLMILARGVLISVFSFAFLLVVVGAFALKQVGYTQHELRLLSPGIVWLIYLFAGTLCLSYSYLSEYKNQAFAALALSRIDPIAIYLAKSFVNFLIIALLQLLVLGGHSLLFGLTWWDYFFSLYFIALLGGLGFVVLGTLIASIAVTGRNRELLLPLIFFPLCIPLVAADVSLMRNVIETGALDFSSFWIKVILVFDLVALALGVGLFPSVVRARG